MTLNENPENPPTRINALGLSPEGVMIRHLELLRAEQTAMLGRVVGELEAVRKELVARRETNANQGNQGKNVSP